MTRVAACPTCKAPSERAGNKLFPFCSSRCHLVDLGRWLGEEYRVPSDEPADPELIARELSTKIDD